jgi:hypothetical protein
MSYQKITLTRRQIERMAVFLGLQENINSVTIEQTSDSGIGATHWAVYHTNKLERDWQEEITDVSTW